MRFDGTSDATGHPRRHLVFVEANTSGTGVLALHTARRLGLAPVLVTNRPERYAGLAEADCEVLLCDTGSAAALRAALADRFAAGELAGVTSTSDFYVAVAAELAGWLGLPHNPVAAMRACRDKALLRALLGEAGVHQPRFAVVRALADVRAAVAEVGLPCVVKPVDDSASYDVLLCTSEEQVAAHAAGILARTVNVRGLPTARTVLVEEYLDGPELSVELFSWRGTTHLVGITDKSVTAPPHFVERRHLFPAELSPDLAAEVERAARAAVDAAGVTLGATHTEVKLTPAGVAVLEVNPRPAGGMIPALVEHATGTDLLEQQVRVAAGLAPDLVPRCRGHAGIQFLLAGAAGLLSHVDGVAAARLLAHEVVVTAAPGTVVGPPRSGYDRLGHVIAHGDSADEVVAALAAATAALDVVVDPVIDTAELGTELDTRLDTDGTEVRAA
jgi:cysteine synthase A